MMPIATPARSLRELLEPRVAVEQEFARLGHSYRHGKMYRHIEHRFTRPLLRAGLQAAGLYRRGMANALRPVVRHIAVPCDRLPAALAGFRILHLSDFHIDITPRLVDALIPLLKPLRPDVAVFTGDYRFEDYGPCEPIYPLMRRIMGAITARHGIFGVLGNHDAAEIAYGLEDLGVRMLVNEAVSVGAAANRVWLLGVDDPFDYRCHDLARALGEVDSPGFQILLAHAPELYHEAEEAGIDLYLSGHTHAGQIRLPILGALRQNARCPRAYSYGAWSHGRLQGYTSAGVGCSGLPVRFGCPPEIVLLELTRRS